MVHAEYTQKCAFVTGGDLKEGSVLAIKGKQTVWDWNAPVIQKYMALMGLVQNQNQNHL